MLLASVCRGEKARQMTKDCGNAQKIISFCKKENNISSIPESIEGYST